MLNTSAIDCVSCVRLGFVASVAPGRRPSMSLKGGFLVLDERKIAFFEIFSKWTALWRDLSLMPCHGPKQTGRVKAATTFLQFIDLKGGSNGSGS